MNQSQDLKLMARQLRWIDALVSGKYKQTKRYLHTKDGYCCLGVICELYKEDHPDATWAEVGEDDNGDSPFEFRVSGELNSTRVELIPLLTDWIGLRTGDGKNLSNGTSLADLNDKGASFEAVAELLTAMPEQWFVPAADDDGNSNS